MEFNSFEKSDIRMEQLQNRYWAGSLFLENGEKIYLDSRPTLDKATERVSQIFQKLKPNMNNLEFRN